MFGMSFTFDEEVNLIVQHITGSAKSLFSWYVSVYICVYMIGTKAASISTKHKTVTWALWKMRNIFLLNVVNIQVKFCYGRSSE